MINTIDSFSFTRTPVSSGQSYSETLRTQRQQAKDTSLKLKKLKYSFKSISSKILRSKTSAAARQAAGQAKREVIRLKWEKRNGDHDSEEIDAAIAHAKAIERVAKKKVKHLEEEERAEAAGKADGITEGVDPQEEADPQDDTSLQDEMQDTQYAAQDVMAAACQQPAMADITNEMLSDMTEEMQQMQEEMGLGELSDALLATSDEVDPEDLKMLKIKHRNKEMRDIAKADAEYLKSLFSHYEKMKQEAACSSGQSGAAPSGGTVFSADSAGSMPVVTATVAAAPMVVDVSV